MRDRALIEKKMWEENPHVTSQYEIDCLVDFVLDNYVKELEPNILEWIHNEPFSKIYVGEECVSSLLQYWGHEINWHFYPRPSHDFTEVLRCFRLYKEDNFRSPYSLLEHYRRQEWRKMQLVSRERIYERELENDPEKERLAIWLTDTLCFFYLEELEQNVLEWVEHRELSEIYVGELTLPMVLKAWNETDDISDVMESLYLYKMCDYRYPYLVLNKYKRMGCMCGGPCYHTAGESRTMLRVPQKKSWWQRVRDLFGGTGRE